MNSTHKVENPKTPLSKKSTINDDDILSTALLTEKQLCNTYVTAMHEASHESFYSLLFDMLKDTTLQHRKLFDLQFQHGWCSLTPAEPAAVAALKQEFTENKQQLN